MFKLGLEINLCKILSIKLLMEKEQLSTDNGGTPCPLNNAGFPGRDCNGMAARYAAGGLRTYGEQGTERIPFIKSGQLLKRIV